MNVQVIMRDGAPEYAVLPWDDYQALLNAVGRPAAASPAATPVAAPPKFSELTALREAQGMSLEALSRSVGISPAYLGLIETGERDPDAAIRRALARALGLSGWGDDA
ncbi:helix-turn-helix domain-containing protein [Stutzerimonas nitrititolerans]|uniref:helix-turn-helix domain-containing protein n=1 Tax=Stutzerimonas nitrititolerans TaxID=2482751 RepID=UPI00289AE29B|nr:helix-turn-helix transcriptional regulator [Stutzerimonas nitrititolerans]